MSYASFYFWRVEAVNDNNLLRLRAEMKVPGKAWLEFESIQVKENKTKLVQTAYFAPKGILGLLYWYLLYPFHAIIFSAMINAIAERAELNMTASVGKSDNGL